MKILLLICVLSFAVSNAQSNKEIASVYIKRSEESLNNLEVKLSKVHFDKAMKYVDSITNVNVAKLGMKIHYELRYYAKAKEYSNKYFFLVKNKKSEEYLELLDLSVDINEELEAKLEKDRKIEEERIRKEKELRKIDSLKTLWKNKSDALTLKVDSIYDFNKNNIALYTSEGNFGVITDRGEILIEATEYKDGLNSEGFIILKNRKEETNKVYCFNTNDKVGFLLPNASDFNPLSTHYGEIMLPRGNGRLVTYPNNSYEPLVYDLNVKRIVRVANEKELLKSLKKSDIIDKFNKDGEIKINKEWYDFGGHVGGGIHPLYFNKSYQVHSFLCSIDGKVLRSSSGYQYIGAFYNNKLQTIKDGKTIWINQNGTKVSAAKDEYTNYIGDSKVVRLSKGAFQLIRNGVIVIGDKELERMGDFLRKNRGN
jgi:hypothetical protein